MPQASPSECDIVIIGGGMMGASLALMLARALPKQKLLLLEAKPLASVDELPTQPSFDARSTALSPTSAELFEHLGLWRALAPQAAPISHIHVSDRGYPGRARFGPDDNANDPLGYVVPNLSLGRELLNQLQSNAAIETVAPAEVLELLPNRRGMHVVFSSPAGERALQSKLVILADGAGSPLAGGLGIATHTHSYGQCALIANVAYDRPHQNHAFERFTSHGPLALLPLPGPNQTESALVWTRPLEQLDTLAGESEQELLKDLQEAFGYRLGRFRKISEPHFYPLSLTQAEEQVRSSLVLMGNAAHSLHPVAGQGFNLALRDAARLTQILRRGAADGSSPGALNLLQQYEQEQAHDQWVTLGLSDAFIKVFASGQPALIAGRTLGLIGLELVPAGRESFLRHMAGRAQPKARWAGGA